MPGHRSPLHEQGLQEGRRPDGTAVYAPTVGEMMERERPVRTSAEDKEATALLRVLDVNVLRLLNLHVSEDHLLGRVRQIASDHRKYRGPSDAS